MIGPGACGHGGNGRLPLIEGCSPDRAPAAADPIGDQPEPAREEARPQEPFPIQDARRAQPSGGRPRDAPTSLTFVSSARLTTASPLHRARVSRRSPTASSRLHPEIRRSPLGDSGSIPRSGSTLDAAA
jgi:hypothetical protein